MGVIRVLPDAVANTIAAGEVVERPTSVVKELVENALDAGATAVHVEIRHGGTSFIQVSDNGCGMSAEDVPLAFERHATSKIAGAEDLLRIRSLGFRGEALPSIAAISRTRLITARAEDATGTQIQLDGGRRVLLTSCPPRAGTLVEVRDLFFNTPARRKFLRSDATETGHILDMIVRLALAHWRVRFRLATPARVLLETEPARGFDERARAVFGGETARHLLPVEGESHGVRVTGLIGKPFIARANRSGQHWYVNGRWVRALPLSIALQEGFAGFLMHGQFPVSVLFVELDPQQVDVNVHPTKQEVRLSDERALKRLLAGLIAQRLRQEPDLSPRLQPSRVFHPARTEWLPQAAASVAEPEGRYDLSLGPSPAHHQPESLHE
jgi:DNA mismatch repair protein MutL